ncbi:MAG: Rieske 2Fe-2S domain-containing protein [Treponema sp.]|nr:Rieske 2Fe-2S domain-containing protein [Treponema sp.]
MEQRGQQQCRLFDGDIFHQPVFHCLYHSFQYEKSGAFHKEADQYRAADVNRQF